MRTVTVTLGPPNDSEVAVGFVAIQKKENNNWRTTEVLPLKSDSASKQRMLMLDDDERLVIEGRTNADFVLDKEQFTMRRVITSAEDFEVVALFEPAAGPLPDGTESQIGVWREMGDKDWSRTGKRYRIY